MAVLRITLMFHLRQARIDRRTVFGAVLLGGLLSARSSLRTRAQEDAPSPEGGAVGTPTSFSAAVFSGMGFVGEAEHVPIGEAFIAIVVAEPTPGKEQREVRALLYGDPENLVQEWFTGQLTDDRLDLVSDTGARLTAELTSDGVTGTMTLGDGTAFAVQTVPASGVAGLYSVTLFPDGRVEGTSERGAQLEGHLGAQTDEPNIYPLAGTLTPPEGAPQEFTVPFLIPAAVEEPSTLRVIVLADGRMRGGAKKPGEGKVTIPILA